jgi:ABC-type antimicrobial peptide transport system permease subunit
LKILNEEYWLLGLSVLIGVVSSLIPAIQVYKMNISKILADA